MSPRCNPVNHSPWLPRRWTPADSLANGAGVNLGREVLAGLRISLVSVEPTLEVKLQLSPER